MAWQSLFGVGTVMLWGDIKVMRSPRASGGILQRGQQLLSPACQVQFFLKASPHSSLLSHLQVGLLLEGLKHPLESSQSQWHRWTESIRK